MKKIHSAFAPFLGILILLAVWFLLCRAEVFSPYLLPTPQKVFDSFLRMLFSGELLRDVLISFIRILKGFGIAFLLAFLLGMFRALLPAAEKYCGRQLILYAVEICIAFLPQYKNFILF